MSMKCLILLKLTTLTCNLEMIWLKTVRSCTLLDFEWSYTLKYKVLLNDKHKNANYSSTFPVLSEELFLLYYSSHHSFWEKQSLTRSSYWHHFYYISTLALILVWLVVQMVTYMGFYATRFTINHVGNKGNKGNTNKVRELWSKIKK